jgi:hypothetical protein
MSPTTVADPNTKVADQRATGMAKMNVRHETLTATTYKNNIASNYTEIIERYDQQFDYESNRNLLWGPEELSLFYGTPLYHESSQAQKLALNHLYWITQYNQTAATEANAILYNQVTEGVFDTVGGYGILCQELSLETEQEHHHIHAFHRVGHKSRQAIFGETSFGRPKPNLLHKKRRQPPLNNSLSLPRFDWADIQDQASRALSRRLCSGHGMASYSSYLQALQAKGQKLPTQSSGLLGQVVPSQFSRLLTINFGSSPFSACFFYATRYLANMLLKNYEHRYLTYFKQRQQADLEIAAPTAISYYHMLDESFHTTTSQLISQDLYKEFNQPTLYEQLMANFMFYRGQEVLLSGLSGVLPATFRNDGTFLQPLYQILRSPIFGLDHQEALQRLAEGVCQEHDGYHMNLKHHHRMMTTARQSFQPMHYLWDVNRNLKLMERGGSIERNLRNNRRAFETFRDAMQPLAA